ncbi:hypothetical protein [Pseudogemmobacter sonorensis]|uniref:DUF7940 domain-containing protein n=1 Tax=Pseudogemmobacter sonorensis TaxID=2989681 RepID=UPI00367F681C
MRLIPDWRRAWRYHSTQSMAVLAVLPLVWIEIPPDLKSHIPGALMPWILSAVALAGILGRLRDQGGADMGEGPGPGRAGAARGRGR